MATVKKPKKIGPGPYNPQKATAYVGKGVLKDGGGITPVPNGPLVKKKGPFKGSTLKKGGTVKKAQMGDVVKSAPIMKDGGKTPAWQRKAGKNPAGGLNAKGVASYRKANPGSKLKTAVTTKPSKLKPGSKPAKRRKSFYDEELTRKRANTEAKGRFR